MAHVAKFYAWLEVNEHTPVGIKLLVLDSCVFGALLYGVEAWGDVSHIEDKLRKIELKALKAILKVKKGTTNDLVYHELRRPDIISKIKDRQYKFFDKLRNTDTSDASVRSALELCKDSRFIRYYFNLKDNNTSINIQERENRIMNSADSMCIYYRELFSDLSIIYSSMSNDYYRYIITRWRLSNHTLQIEIGRYSRPKIERGDRVCEHCHILEDEFHAIFVCPLYDSIRSKFNDILSERNISVFLNPAENQIQSTATFLHELERFRDDMFGVI